MIQPNNIEFFYAEEETSERIWRLDAFMDRLYKIISRSAMVGVLVALGLHIKQRVELDTYAAKVSQRIEK